MFKNFGYYLIFTFVCISLFLWFIATPGLKLDTETVGKSLGIIGVTLFALTFVLNTRIRLLENLFGGIDKVYIAHHITGGLTFVFLLFHPLFLLTEYLELSLASAFDFLIPSIHDVARSFGILALLTMIFLLVITFYLNLPYHIWKFTHKFMGLAFIFASLHVLLVKTDISFNMPLRAWVIALMVIGLSAYLYKTILGRFTLPRSKYTLSSTKKLNNDVYEVILSATDKPITFIPGQFCFFEFENKITGTESHPFSIASKPGDPNLRFVIKVSGDFTSKLDNLETGETVFVEGAYGGFKFSNHYKKQIWIAGGIGITPFLSMVTSVSVDQQVDLYYSVKTESEFIGLEELEQISKQNKNITLIKWLSETRGRLTMEEINKTSGNLSQNIIYLCGPVAMMRSMVDQAKGFGIYGRNIRMEEFELV
ncbi:ferric reductase-like transmembrane domain-containing protein [Candidatus Microgenomates bacterium]|nr:ferric reductase-like transmembrane domain-containing protein [Candidatus Microgenomates bacterium]